MKLYVTGGREKKRLFKDEEEWKLYESGLILRLDDESAQADLCVEYVTPPEARAEGGSSVVFKAGERVGDRLYTATSTEVMVYRLPDFQIELYISIPVFNDLHHVCPSRNGTVLAASTGLDMVFEFSLAGKILREWDVLEEELWKRFSRDVDYRRVLTTKPHRSHPNFVFHVGDQIWVTRHVQRDAFCLTEKRPPIPIALEKPHDGHVYGDRIYFTTVNGYLVAADKHSLEIAEVIDLNRIDNDSDGPLGWCRGLLILDERLMWIGFTRVRKTKFKENLNWIKHAFRDVERPTRIALYDIKARRRLKEINLEPHDLGVVFGIFQAD